MTTKRIAFFLLSICMVVGVCNAAPESEITNALTDIYVAICQLVDTMSTQMTILDGCLLQSGKVFWTGLGNTAQAGLESAASVPKFGVQFVTRMWPKFLAGNTVRGLQSKMDSCMSSSDQDGVAQKLAKALATCSKSILIAPVQKLDQFFGKLDSGVKNVPDYVRKMGEAESSHEMLGMLIDNVVRAGKFGGQMGMQLGGVVLSAAGGMPLAILCIGRKGAVEPVDLLKSGISFGQCLAQ